MNHGWKMAGDSYEVDWMTLPPALEAIMELMYCAWKNKIVLRVDAHVNCMSYYAQTCANAPIVIMGNLKMTRPTWLHPIQAVVCDIPYVMLCYKFSNATRDLYSVKALFQATFFLFSC